ncbi:MAG: acetate kinase [Eubacteriales bacterium]|jgi:acetate kinase|nr:acetate kinase [Eubacteriales bacterium]
MKVLVVNAGSSSLKYQLFNTETNNVDAKGICERIGIDGRIEHSTSLMEEKIKCDMPMPNHSVATRIVVEFLTDPEVGCITDMSEIEAVGHRIVHGGDYFSESCLVDDSVIAKLELCVDIAPLHTSPHLMGIRGCMEVMPGIPQVVVFDTAFHQTMPSKAYFYPIPYTLYEKYKIRRYGFHGTSHRYVSHIMCDILGRVENTKIVTCHIGNGSSISAVKDGKVIDTSMGFTPLDGVEMGTRCGSIDPSIVTFIMKHENIDPDDMNDFMNKQCGFLGVSGKYADSRDIEKAILEGDKKSLLAANILAYQIQKYIGSYAAAMNGLDAVVFTAGMGENNPELRTRVCTNMEYFGIELDAEINEAAHHQSNIVKLSTDASRVGVYLIPTNEELVIASETQKIVSGIK